MSETTVAPNNKAIVYRSKPTREKPRAADTLKRVDSMQKRGRISNKARDKYFGGKDEQPIDASSR